MDSCPFYGYRWPSNSPKLRHVGGNECGLDLERHGPCGMEQDGQAADYFDCPMVRRERNFLQAGRRLIVFERPDEDPERLDAWERTHGR